MAEGYALILDDLYGPNYSTSSETTWLPKERHQRVAVTKSLFLFAVYKLGWPSHNWGATTAVYCGAVTRTA